IAFINSLGDSDSVAIVTFADKVTLAQDYTTDKAQLIAVIDGLQTGGRTALYSAGVLGVETVVNAPSNRRVVVLLSDGSEYGGASTNAREEALALARQKGASFYTIGLGYGADRTYLEGTNGAFFESPEADQLVGIYTTIAENLRSEYIITVEANVPLDGTAYRFDLQANTPEGASNIASSVLIAPVPIPVIKLGNTDINLAEPLTENVQLWYLVMADDRPLTIETSLTTNGVTTPIESELFDSNYVVTIRPRDLAPGDYVSTITATDSNGDTATLDTPFI
ncbi:MAG TPA: VWA domain-containing protein, partial [Aggregatilineales bacterium]|nr:VWA domain-containing protein [Aggregatilineales bacterium]